MRWGLSKPSRLRRIAFVTLSFAALALPAASARADGPRTPFVVARGHSFFQAPWRVRFGEERTSGPGPDYATFLFSVGDEEERKEHSGGFYESIPLPLPRSFTFDPVFGSEFDNFPEADVAGTAGPRVARIAVDMADGSVFEAVPVRAPNRLLGRHPRLARFRFFDIFFPISAEPVSISAYDRAAKLLERRRGPGAAP
jgi:hypothetical protein